jgi:hypothetical protein
MISTLDIVLLNMLSFLLGIGTGLTVCCKYKEKFMSRSKSTDKLDNMRQLNHHTSPIVQAMPPPSAPTEITLKV